MARREVNIGIEGNDGTGDSIRESFRKVNENFQELYAVFGIGGRISFTILDDTPDVLTPNTVSLVNQAGTGILLSALASDSELDAQLSDTIQFDYSVPGKLILTTSFKEVADDLSPALAGPLYAANWAIAGVEISENAAEQVNLAHQGVNDITINDLVITKGYADGRYVSADVPLRTRPEPTGNLHYSLIITRYNNFAVEIESHYNEDQELINTGHGLDSSLNGSPYVFVAEDRDPEGGLLFSNTTYYIRVVNDTTLWLYTEGNKQYSTTGSAVDAETFKLNVSGTIAIDDKHILRDATYDPDLAGNFLSDITMPRNAIVRRQGDTMTGTLYLSDHPGELAGQGYPNGIVDMQAATKFYVDNTSYSSPEVLFVSTQGDDTMKSVPPGKEGTSFTYAFKTINAAARRAEELIRAGTAVPGPYMQQLTYTIGGNIIESVVMKAQIESPSNTQARFLLESNRLYLQESIIGFVNYTFPTFDYNIDLCKRDVGLLIDAIAIDINRGINANYLTRQAAERYYASSSGRRAITVQKSETLAAIAEAKEITRTLLTNDLYQKQEITAITRDQPARVTTAGNHGWNNGNQVIIKNVAGMLEIEGKKAWIKKFSENSFELYDNPELTLPFNTETFTGYTTGGVVGLLYTFDEEQYFDDGIVLIENITQTDPVRITTKTFHFLSNDDSIQVNSVSTMTTLNTGEYYAKKIDDYTLDLYTAPTTTGIKITDIQLSNPVKITTEIPHGYGNNAYVTITLVSGSTELNQNQFYVVPDGSDNQVLYLYYNISVPVDGAAISPYVAGGEITQNSFDGTGLPPYIDPSTNVPGGGNITKDSDASIAAITAIDEKWDLVTTILRDGIDAGTNIAYGSTYKIALTNGSKSFLDQTNPANTDALPGKVIRGRRSEAIGQIVGFTNDNSVDGGIDPVTGNQEPNPTTFQMHLLSAKDFEIGEPIEFGNFVKKKEVVIRIEAGNYYEDYPIRLMNNVSLKGDEFRRVIINPKTETNSNWSRTSQSKWARQYFYRDNEFDGLTVARGGTDFRNQEGFAQGKFGYHYLVDPNKPINIGPTVTNVGGYTNAANIILANKDYLREETLRYIDSLFPALNYNREKSKRDTGIIIDSIVNDLVIGGEERALETQGAFQQLNYSLSNNVETTYDAVTANYDYTTGILVIDIGAHTLTQNDYIKLRTESLTFTCASDGNTTPYAYPRESDPAWNTQLEIISITTNTITVNVGLPPAGSTGDSPHTFVSALAETVLVTPNTTQLDTISQEVACSNAILNLPVLIADLLEGRIPDHTIIDSSYTPTDAAYTPFTGNLDITIPGHDLDQEDYIEILQDGITFTCASDGNTVPYSYPRPTDPAYKAKLRITQVVGDVISVNVGVSPETSIHTFVSATSGCITKGLYEAGLAVVTDIEPVNLLNGIGETGSIIIVSELIAKINFAFNADYNPPLRNDQMDMFLMSDTTIVRNVSARGHGGFMCVLDPEGQVLTKSPYIQTASSFSKSIGEKVFAGGMFVDAYVGNLPTNILSKTNNFIISVQSNVGEGLRLRPPQLPCPFYVEGRRYQVNAISDYDSGQGTAILYLDANSNDRIGYDETQFTDGLVAREVFLQTAGNRSILANDFTQINDLGYGLVCVNAAFSEQVSTFTYYCQAAMYAANGSEIRALNCSNGYGRFGLVSEGADPNEIPDQVNLTYDMVMPLKAWTDNVSNVFDDPAILVYDAERPPNGQSIVTINHPTKGVLNYRISNVVNLSDRDNDGVQGNVSSDDIVNTGVIDVTNLAGVIATANQTYTNVSTTTNGSGTGLTVNVVTQATGTVGSGGQAVITVNRMGENYNSGDVITVLGTAIGGASPANDITFDVNSIYGTGPAVISNSIYRLEIIADNVSAEDYYSTIQEDIANNDYIEYRDSFQLIFSGLRDIESLVTRPSTAINFDESDTNTYRSISFQNTDALSRPLPILITTGGAFAAVVGETITQVSSGASGVVFSKPSGNQVELRYVVGDFDTTETDPLTASELIGSVSGSLGINSIPVSLPKEKILATVEVGYDYVEITTLPLQFSNGYGDAQGDTRIAVELLTSANEYSDDRRVIRNARTESGLFPGDTNYLGAGDEGGMRFTWAGQIHNIVDYQPVFTLNLSGPITVNKGDSLIQSISGATAIVTKDVVNGSVIPIHSVTGTFDTSNEINAFGPNSIPSSIIFSAGWGFIEISNYVGAHIRPSSTVGLAVAMPNTDPAKILNAGLAKYTTGEITVAISLLRATGHDFTQIGTGSYNESNYPNVILGPAVNPLGDYYTDSPTATSAQVWERRKGRVFFVSTDQDGFFRVGKFFSVDQATGDITFAGEIGLSNANSLGFKKGVTINEFSADDSFADQSGQAVPTEKAVSSYINRVLGYTVSAGNAGSQIPASGNRIGPGFLTLNGFTTMEGTLDTGNFKIINVGNPVDPKDAATKLYVDSNSEAFNNLSSLRNFSEINPTNSEMVVCTGNKIIYTEIETGTTNFAVGQDIIGTESNGRGTIVQLNTITDLQLGTVRRIVYTPTLGQIDTSQDEIENYQSGSPLGGTAPCIYINNGNAYNEYTHASASSLSDVTYTVSKTSIDTQFNIQINAGAITNTEVSGSAAIAQSKLNLTAATTRNSSTGITASDRGVASFDDDYFTATNGWISLLTATGTADGIELAKLRHIPTGKVLGRSTTLAGVVETLDFSTVIASGGGISHSSFGTYSNSGGATDVLLRTNTDTYGVKKLSSGNDADSIVLRKTADAQAGIKAGAIRASALILGGDDAYEVLYNNVTDLSFKTPGQATIIQAQGTNSETVLVKMPGQLNVGNPWLNPAADGTEADPLEYKTTESAAQTGSDIPTNGGRQGKGFVATNWLYTKAIEDLNDGNGFTFGGNTGFSQANTNSIIAFTQGTVRLRIDATNVTAYHDIVPDQNTSLVKRNLGTTTSPFGTLYVQNIVGATVSGGSFSGTGNISPDTDNTYNIGTSALRYATVYATLFDGVASSAKYADLAENYLADEYYEPGTVVIFGGKKEITVVDLKGDNKVAGVVSHNPAFLMNSELKGEFVTPIALQGRVMCKVVGKVNKGDMLVTSAISGYAIAEAIPSLGTVLGKAVGEKTDDGKGVVEIVVGRL